MRVEIRNIESNKLIMNIEGVMDVGEGCFSMMLVQTESRNILCKVR